MPIKYIPYYPNTVEGQAILDNITRTQRVLRYRENDKVYDRIKRGMPYYEVEPLETIGEPSGNLVIRGECISACAYLKEKGVKLDLVYIDPPFASGADYSKKVYLRKNPKLAEKIAIAEQELDIEELRAFEEKMYGDIWQKEDYLNWLFENLVAIKSIMNVNSSIYLHLDSKIGHYAKILMDEVFGEENFRNEIIWHYYNKMQGNVGRFASNHDVIFYYTIGEDAIFNTVREERVKKKIQQKRVWDKETQSLKQAKDNDGNLVYYEDTHRTVDDVWRLPYIMPADKKQLLDYSTQKPDALLERIIKASCNEFKEEDKIRKMIVADFFGGSGVTARISNELGLNFIHSDIGINSIQVVRDELMKANANFQILEIKDGVSLFRNPQQTMDKLATLIPGLQKGIKGISNFWFGAITTSKEGIVPIYVPNLLNTQEKIMDIPTINTIINQELQNLEVNAKKVIVYYIDIDDQKALEKFIKDNNATEIEVEFKDLKNLLHDVVIEDIIDFKTTKTKDGYETEITKFVSDRLIQKIGEFNQKGNLRSVANGKQFSPINISAEGLELIELIALDCENTEGQWRSTTEIKIDKLGYVISNGVKSKDFWDGRITSDKKPLRIKVRNISGDETIKIVG